MVQHIMIDIKYHTLALLESIEIKGALSVLVVYLCDVTGVSSELLYTFIYVIMLDFLLGLITAIKFKRFKFFQLKRGVLKLVLWVSYIILVSYGDRAIQEIFPLEQFILAKLLVASIIFTEISSILKHCKELNVPVPDGLSAMVTGISERIKNKIGGLSGKKGRDDDEF